MSSMTTPTAKQATTTAQAMSSSPAVPPSGPPADGPPPSPNVDLARIKYGAWLIGAAFVLLAVVVGVAISQFKTAADVTAVVASVAAVVGTIIGAFFGVQAGSSGKEAAVADRTQAERVTRMALAKLDPAAADDVLNML
jgi:hypothetical protein